MNELPELRLDLAGREFIATPLNARLYTFAGRTVLQTGETIENSSRNHIFLLTGQDHEDIETGTYVFHPETVGAIGSILLKYGFPCFLNRRDIPECDENAYQTYIAQQITTDEISDFFPEDWK